MAEFTQDLEGMGSLDLNDNSGEEETLEVRQAMAQQCFKDCHKCCYECGSPDNLSKDCLQYKAHIQSLNKKGGSHQGTWTPQQKEKVKENADLREQQ